MIFITMTVLLLRDEGVVHKSISPVWLTKRDENISLNREMFYFILMFC